MPCGCQAAALIITAPKIKLVLFELLQRWASEISSNQANTRLEAKMATELLKQDKALNLFALSQK
jgi:hypothetical protein